MSNEEEEVLLCPHCAAYSQFSDAMYRYREGRPIDRMTQTRGKKGDAFVRIRGCLHCGEFVLDVLREGPNERGGTVFKPERAYPTKPVPPALSSDVPEDLCAAYKEAWELRAVSERAAAVMARRCLQLTLRKQGIVKRTLDAEIDEAEKRVGSDLATQLHYVRTVGNIGAHPMDADGGTSFDALLDVQPGEVVALFQAIREAFDEFYVKPARKQRNLDELNAKLMAAKKPPLKP